MRGHEHDRYERRLARLHRAARWRLLVHGLVTWLALLGAVLLAQLVVLGALEPPRAVRLPLVCCGWLLVAAAAYPLLWRPWRGVRTRGALAGRLDRAGGLADTLAAAEEALRRPDRWSADTPVRAVLLERLLARAATLLESLSLPRLLPVWRPVGVFAALGLVLVAGVWLERASPETMERGRRALQAPWQERATAGEGSLRLEPGPTVVAAGSSLTVAVRDLAGGGGPVVCEVRAGSGYWQTQAALPASVGDAHPVHGAPFERWQTTLTAVTEDLHYRFRRGARVSEQRLVSVQHPPLLQHLAARVTPPAYTGRPVENLARLPAYLEAPVGSVVELVGRASQPLRAAELVTAAGDTLALAVAADTLQGRLVVDQARRFWPVLHDRRGLEGRGELVYEVVPVPDRLPAARLARPGDDGALPLAAPLLLQAEAQDDYGLIAVDLLARRGDVGRVGVVVDLPGSPTRRDDREGWQRLPLLDTRLLPVPGRRDWDTGLGPLPVAVTLREGVDAGLRLDLALEPGGLRLVPGDVLELVLEARDNRVPGPAGVGRSAVLRLQVPSSLEILRAREESQSAHRDDLAGMRARSESLSAELERLRRELLRNPVPDWDRRQLLQSAIERQQELQAELGRIAEAMQQDLEALAENRLTSPQLLDQMDRIAELMADARRDGMQELLERMREALAEMSPAELSAAMEDLNRTQQDMLRRLDAAMDMLRDLAREQQLEGLTELAAELIRKQQDLATTQQARQDDLAADEADAAGDVDAEQDAEQDAETDTETDADANAEAADQSDRDADAGQQESQPPGPSPEDLARRQEALAQELASLEQRLQETLEQLDAERGEDPSAAAEAMREALQQALQQLEQQQTRQKMEQAAESLQSDQSDKAQADMQQSLSDLAGLYNVLLRSQMAMQMAMRTEQSEQMRNVAADLLALSERQEALALDVPTSLREVRSDDLLRRQHLVLQGATTLRDRLADVAGAAPREVLQMLEQLDVLIAGFGRILDQLQEGRTQGTRMASEQSLAALNQLVINLLTQAQMTGEGGGSGSPQPMLSQQLQQMAQEQSGLNALAEQLSRQQNRQTEEVRAGMRRLQQGQQGLSGRARDLAEDLRLEQQEGGGRLLGDLGELAREMERVGDDMAGGLVTPDVMRRQERILSRLLDMHNASRERDWSRRRESRTADDVLAGQEGTLGAEPRATTPEAGRWRAIQEAPPAYRDQVRDYFREIQRLHESTGRDADGNRARPDGLP